VAALAGRVAVGLGEIVDGRVFRSGAAGNDDQQQREKQTYPTHDLFLLSESS
jgi:hypothetical protein